ncbi:MAG TPA: methyltransferase domain-containing protein [Thermoanaerobaculia bacterium]|nr:methyltransferase domain-containing protein [Thermoanaerobaculia bacterium]
MSTWPRTVHPEKGVAASTGASHERRIVDYYLQTEEHFRSMWNMDTDMALHYGFWIGGVRNHSQAVARMNQELADRLAVSSSDRVLDAGCGVGGTAIFLAKNYGCSVVGVNIVDRQLRIAADNVRRHDAVDQVDLICTSFLNLGLADSSVSAILYIESACHAQVPEQLLREAYRVLRPGGRIAVTSYFRGDRMLTEREEAFLRFWEEAWSMAPLITVESFLDAMQRVGFRNISQRDETRAIAPSARRMYYLSYFGLAIKAVRRLWRRSTPKRFQNVRAARIQDQARRSGLWSYRIIVGQKEA